ncbi:MAG TPA: hypothetical protein VEH27_04495 [Methylomirabilota bacterium]|nr:hypothetical protein [Methylomirabilota bacterium]
MSSRKRVTIVNEFPGQESDRMAADLAVELQRLLPEHQVVSINGLIAKYRPGGLKPSRLLNWVYLHARVGWECLFRPPETLIVVSSPPLIQITAAALGSLRNVRVVSWLMDYHPEIEARMVERTSRGIARLLRSVDKVALDRTALVVTLDPAMEGLLRANGYQRDIIVHPTWAPSAVRALSEVAGDDVGGTLRLMFVGNLGRSHSLETFEGLLKLLPGKVNLLALGASDLGLAQFRALAERAGIPFEGHGRLPFAEFKQRIAEFKPHYGLVFMHPSSGGLVSPSKFVTYLQQGIPILYVGPEGSNAWLACSRFDAGLAVSARASEAELREAAFKVSSPERHQSFRGGTRAALNFFNSHDATTLATALVKKLWPK